MNSTTRSLIRDIQKKLQSPVTGQKEFATEAAVIDYAVRFLYNDLKKQRLL